MNPEAEAKRVLKETGTFSVPIPVDDIARRLGALISYRPLEGDTSGMLFRERGTAIIGVNSTHPATRQRFTIAHELGHLRLHKGRPLIVDAYVRINRRDGLSSLATDAEEIEANAFAAELLIPSRQLQKEMDRLRSKYSQDDLVDVLARQFAVSVQAMTYRLINRGLLKTAP